MNRTPQKPMSLAERKQGFVNKLQDESFRRRLIKRSLVKIFEAHEELKQGFEFFEQIAEDDDESSPEGFDDECSGLRDQIATCLNTDAFNGDIKKLISSKPHSQVDESIVRDVFKFLLSNDGGKALETLVAGLSWLEETTHELCDRWYELETVQLLDDPIGFLWAVEIICDIDWIDELYTRAA